MSARYIGHRRTSERYIIFCEITRGPRTRHLLMVIAYVLLSGHPRTDETVPNEHAVATKVRKLQLRVLLYAVGGYRLSKVKIELIKIKRMWYVKCVRPYGFYSRAHYIRTHATLLTRWTRSNAFERFAWTREFYNS